jgi:hypothetical protein
MSGARVVRPESAAPFAFGTAGDAFGAGGGKLSARASFLVIANREAARTRKRRGKRVFTIRPK